MKGTSDSSSRPLSWVLPKDKQLYWSADGKTNLTEWKINFIQASKGAYPEFASLLVKEEIPEAWTEEMPLPERREWDAMNPLEQEMIKIQLNDYLRKKNSWENTKPSFCTFMLMNMTESSEKRSLEQHHATWENAKKDDAILRMYKLTCSAHNFFGSTASLQEQKSIRVKHDTFSWTSPEDLAQYKYRWDKLVKELDRVGIKDQQLPAKGTILRVCKCTEVLRTFNHGSDGSDSSLRRN
jgi:hypothetical protein